MNKIPTEIEKQQESIEIINNTWSKLIADLKNNNYAYDDYNVLKEKDFFNPFFSIMDNLKDKISCNMSQIKYFLRGIHETDEKQYKSLGRYIPNEKFNSVNRMNDKSNLYFYSAVAFTKNDKKYLEKTVAKELRTTEKDELWVCDFYPSKNGKSKKNINLIPNSKYYYGDIVSKMNYSNYKERILHLYLYLLNSKESNVFAPIDKSQPSDKQYELYRPFHFIADYFKGMGYAGIVFKSTVNKSGKNIVIFDVNDVEGDISTRKKIDFL